MIQPNVTNCMEIRRKKQTQKRLFTIISRGFVNPIDSKKHNIRAYIVTILKALWLSLPIMSNETVRCSLPDAFMAPKTVPTIEQQMPTKAIMTMNHRIDTV